METKTFTYYTHPAKKIDNSQNVQSKIKMVIKMIAMISENNDTLEIIIKSD